MATPNNTRAPNLFWRTFILMMLLIVFCVMGWLQSFRVLNETPYAIGAARQIVTMANIATSSCKMARPTFHVDIHARMPSVPPMGCRVCNASWSALMNVPKGRNGAMHMSTATANR